MSYCYNFTLWVYCLAPYTRLHFVRPVEVSASSRRPEFGQSAKQPKSRAELAGFRGAQGMPVSAVWRKPDSIDPLRIPGTAPVPAATVERKKRACLSRFPAGLHVQMIVWVGRNLLLGTFSTYK